QSEFSANCKENVRKVNFTANFCFGFSNKALFPQSHANQRPQSHANQHHSRAFISTSFREWQGPAAIVTDSAMTYK
ncbi:1565_t:CDS:1, partial [Scutellospora calospora]